MPKNPPDKIESTLSPSPTTPKGITLEEIVRLRRKGLTHKEIAQTLNCSKTNIYTRLKGIDIDYELVAGYRSSRAEVLTAKESEIIKALKLKGITPKSARDIRELAVAASTLHGMSRLEEGKSTDNISLISSIKRVDADDS